MFKLRPYQTDMVQRNEECWDGGVKYPVSVLPTGAGKCYRKGTLIMMADGSRKAVEDILVGDQVMGPDSLPRNVLALGRGSEMMYEVMPTKGEPYYVNESHILSLRVTNVNHVITDSLGRRYHSDDVVNIGVLDYLKSNKTFKHCAKGWRVPLEFKHRDLPGNLPPYLLGLWLGDGHSRIPSITTADPEVVEYLEAFSRRNGLPIRVEHQPNNKSKVYHIKSNRKVDVGVMYELRKHNLLKNKHIPEIYLINSREQRLELLAGLLDSDGYLARNSYYDVIFKVEQLANDLAYLARSLGFAAYVTPCFKTCGNTGARGKYHRVSISGDVSLIPTKLKRHQPAPRKQVKNVLRVGIRSVRPVGVEPFYGFMLDGDHLHLLGDFTVSHNTVVASEIIRREQERDGYFAAIAHRQELVSQISLALARQGVMHDIVAPSSVRRFCGDLHNRELGRCFVSSRANGFVGGVDTLVRRDLGKLKDRVSLMFQDECFPAGTLITLFDGSTKPIEDVVVGDSVVAYDEQSDCLTTQKVDRLFKNPTPSEMVVVKVSEGTTLMCTKGHPFYTRRGWVNAAELTSDDEVLYDQVGLHPVQQGNIGHQRGSKVSLAQDRKDFLQQRLQQEVHKGKPENPSTGAAPRSSVHAVWGGRRPNILAIQPMEANWPCLLWQSMCGDLSESNIKSDNVRNQSQTRIKKNGRKQPHEGPRDSEKGIGNIAEDRAPTISKGWERARRNRCRKDVNGYIGGLRFPATSGGVDCGLQTPCGDASTLQDRLCERKLKDSHRSGRPVSQQPVKTGPRPTERSGFIFTRLESVSVLQRDDIEFAGDGFVYNIEVRGDHTYIANGVVVHNCHHVLAENKWGKAAAMFPKANGLFVTATPCRADGKGLGRHADGLFDTILEGPSMREIIRMGSLTDYKIYAPPNNIDLTNVAISRATGDYNQTQLQEASKKQRRGIVGNVVSNYLDYTPNSQAVAFVVDVATAKDTADKFNERGVPAVALSAKNTDAERHEAITKFKAGEIKVIVNVDLLGEGFDCPAIETVIMARPTMSYGLYSQQFGRALRLFDGKQFGIIIDMVGNVKRHGLPDAPRQWSLERSSTKSGGDAGRPVKVCPECTGVYEVGPSCCPYCGYKAVIGAGADPDGGLIEVDSGLRELTAEELAEMRGEIDKLGKEWTTAPNMSKQQYIMFNQHNKSVRSQKRLRDAIAYYAGACRTVGMDDQSIHIQFTTLYGTSITHAQTLRPKDADALSDRIESDLIAMGVDREVG